MWFLALAFVAAAVILMWDWSNAEPSPKARPAFSVWFQGYSNSPSGEKWAVLIITNRDVCTLVFQVPARVSFLGHPDLESRRALFANNPLPRKADCRVAIPLSPSGAWKFVCPVTRYPRREEVAERLPDWLGRLVAGTRKPAISYIDTGWVNQ